MLASLFSLQGVAVLIVVAYILSQAYSRLQRQRKLPPGPKPLPIVGNVRDFPAPGVPEYQHWLVHKDTYGPISSVSILGTTLVILHDKKAAHDIMEKSASKASGRPMMVFSSVLCGYGQGLPFRGYDDGFRLARKMLHQVLGTKALSARFQEVQEAEASRQLARALDEPEKTAGAVMLQSTYGYSIDRSKRDTLIEIIELAMAHFSLAAVPMAWAVDIVPSLQYLPDWFPGAGFKKTAREYAKDSRIAVFSPYNFVKRQMAERTNRPSLVSRLIEEFRQENEKTGTLTPENDETIARVGAALYGAAADTTAITLSGFTMAMAMFPDVQRKAQEEIDRVVGTDRLPSFEDRDNLPYIEGVVKESLRWWTATPLGFPHAADEDIEYNGLHIPKGAYLLPAIWWFLHDPAVYANPDVFEPERFLSPRNEPDPASEAFGYGRRICPGRYFADAGLYLGIVKSLSAFNISKATALGGAEIDIDVKAQPGILNMPPRFQFHVEPRSPQHIDLIRQAAAKYPNEPSDAELLQKVVE